MTKQDYEMIVTYLDNPDNFAAINGCGRKTKITGKTLTKVTAFGHMAVTLCAQGFVKCSGVIMRKKVARYVCTYKNARTFYLGTGSGQTEAETAAGLEHKMNAKCHYFFRMDALFSARANVEPPAVGDAGLPAEMIFDDRDLCHDSQTAFQFSAAEPMLSEDEEEAAHREEEPIDLSEDDETARAVEDGGPEMGNQTGHSAVDVESNAVRTPQQNQRPQQSRGDASVQSVDDVKSSGKTVRSRDRPPPPKRKTSLITAYEEQVKENCSSGKRPKIRRPISGTRSWMIGDMPENRERESQNSGRD
ncbi:hypothetical protein R1sor_005152 [Riccia sorocarpa]|uniref:Uncharacterized protein n=1 Tax=Riccia sorocarpa TaxID=122646 RepID=A0ABD3HKR1_9MARC